MLAFFFFKKKNSSLYVKSPNNSLHHHQQANFLKPRQKNAIYTQFLFHWLLYTQQKPDEEELPLCFSEDV